MRSDSGNGSGLRRTALTMLKMAVFAPMPRVRMPSAASVNAGVCASRGLSTLRPDRNRSCFPYPEEAPVRPMTEFRNVRLAGSAGYACPHLGRSVRFMTKRPATWETRRLRCPELECGDVAHRALFRVRVRNEFDKYVCVLRAAGQVHCSGFAPSNDDCVGFSDQQLHSPVSRFEHAGAPSGRCIRVSSGRPVTVST